MERQLRAIKQLEKSLPKGVFAQMAIWLRRLWQVAEVAGPEQDLNLRAERSRLFDAFDAYWEEKGDSQDMRREFLQPFIFLRTGKYRLREVIGENVNTKALVFSAEGSKEHAGETKLIEEDSRPVIVKCVPFLDFSIPADETDRDRRFRKRFRNRAIIEAAVLHQLDGLHAPKLIDAQFMPHPDNEDKRIFVLVMEQLQGNALDEFSTKIDPIENSRLYSQLFALTLEALQAIHAKGIWHGDIKPQHIFFSPDRTTVQFIDFGASMLPERAASQHAAVAAARQDARSEADVQRMPSYATAVEGVFIGTPGYFSEMDRNTPNAQLQDIYALGKSFNDCLMRHFTPAGVDTTIDRVNNIIQKMTAENPADRISLAEALRQLEV